jgi:hypothetical protein
MLHWITSQVGQLLASHHKGQQFILRGCTTTVLIGTRTSLLELALYIDPDVVIDHGPINLFLQQLGVTSTFYRPAL